MLDPGSEPTVTFLFTLLNTPEPKDSESDFDTQEARFLDPEDWGSQQTSEELRQLHNDCLRLQKKLITSQASNTALEEKLQNMPTQLYQNLTESTLALAEETEATQEQVEVIQEEVLAGQAQATLTQVVQQHLQVARKIQVQTSSLELPNPPTILLSKDNTVQPPAIPSQPPPEPQSALVRPEATDLPRTQEAISPAGSPPGPSNKH
uniref:uncharacterized protein LOC123457740 n=1 Tax=Jaculus jaculus TaxID=51337 RepID=UPI001E1B1EA7|nr:uncharacterized protein LOC123457740 [Jaculus jaculus]